MTTVLVAEPDSYSVNEDATLTVNAANGLLENDFDSSGAFEAESFSNPAHGTVSLVTNGSFVYTPNSGFVGADTFTYTDGDGTNISTATVTINVDHANPVANPDTYLVEAGKTLTVPAATGLLANDIATDGTLEAESFSEPAHGTLSVTTNGSFVYTPNPGFVGRDTFTYSESDGVADASATVTIDVVDAPPIANNDAYVVRAGTTLTVGQAQGLLANDQDPDGSLEADSFSEPAHGTLSVTTNGSFVYTPNSGFVGNDTFTYTDSDGTLTASATVTIQVVDNPPVANADFYHTGVGAKLTVNAAQGLLKNDFDPDNDPIEATSFSNPAHGTLSVTTNGSFIYTPNAGFSGTDTFTYTISDGTLTSSATATIVMGVPTTLAPTVAGTLANQTTIAEAPVNPFFGVTITDPNANATDTLTITLSTTGAQLGTLSGAGLIGSGATYQLAGSAATITSELDALRFTPVNGVLNTSVTTTFALSDQSSAFVTPTTNNTTSVIDTDWPIGPAPAGTTADMIMRDGSNGDYAIYDLGNNAIQAADPLGQVGIEWQVAGVGAFDAPDTSDMILRNGNTGQFEIYDISNNNLTGAAAMGQVGLEWTVSGFGDFSSQSGETDMLMRDSNNGNFEIYDLANNGITSAAPMGQVGLEWSVAGVGDFSTRLNETDMLMRNNNTGAFEIYDIRNNQLTSAASMGQVGLEWSVAGFGDFSGNANETDMLMRNENTGAFEIYDISNNQVTSAASMGQVGQEWQVAGFGPINGAGTSDMLMRNANTGAFEIYDITNNQITTAAPMGQVGLEWSVAGIAADAPTKANAQLAQAMASFTMPGGVLDTSEPSAGMAVPSLASLLTAQVPRGSST